jgi:hypothetical protein
LKGDDAIAHTITYSDHARLGSGCGGGKLVPSRTYEITFVGQADTVARAEFDDCEVSVGPDTTTLLRELPDQGALHGLIQRIADLGLELIDVSVVAPPADVRHETSTCQQLNSGRQTE